MPGAPEAMGRACLRPGCKETSHDRSTTAGYDVAPATKTPPMHTGEHDAQRCAPALRVIDGGRRGAAKIIQLFCEGRLDEVEAELARMQARRARIRLVPPSAAQAPDDPGPQD